MGVRCMLALTAHFRGIHRCLDRAFQSQAVLTTWIMRFISFNFGFLKARYLIQESHLDSCCRLWRQRRMTRA